MHILIVDGYNMIGAWAHLKKEKLNNLARARELLIDDLSEYGSIKKCRVIVVFDAYDVKGLEKKEAKHGVEIVFTKEKETADQYIEKLVKELKSRNRKIWVATSDGVEQWAIFGQGALRKTAVELLQEIRESHVEIKEHVKTIETKRPYNNIPLSEDVRSKLEKMRRGNKT